MDIAAILRSNERMLQIKASAGSGKTYTLTRLYLNRLARCRMDAGEAGAACLARHDDSVRWGEILAITFTNAAATEMRDRVVTTLKSVALGHPARDIPLSPAAAAAWLEIILRDMASLNIRTIDSLLHRIVRASALDLGLPPDFQPAFAGDEVMQPRLDRMLDEAWHGDADKLALLRDVYGEMIRQSDRKGFVAGGHLVRRLKELWDGFLDGSFSRLSTPEELAEREDAVWKACRDAVATFRREAKAAGAEISANGCKACDKIMEGNATFCGSAMFADGGGKLLKGKAARPAPLVEAVGELVRAAGEAGRLFPVLTEARKYARMVRLAQWLCEDFARDSRKDGNVPAALIPLKAVEALSGEYGVPEALCRLGSRLRHFMLDEFQDTSRRQWEAMVPLVAEALSQGGSLSWVGDVKQAIYGWRGGDTRLFDDIARDRELLGMAGACRRESLPFNRRSRRGVVAYNNALFSRLAEADAAREVLTAMLGSGTTPEVLEDGVTSVTEAYADAAQACPDDAPDGGLIRVYDAQAVADEPSLFADGEEEDGEDAAEGGQAVGRALLRTVREIGARRPWSDLLVLVETNNMAHDYAALLMEDGIPVITENSLLLAEHPLVRQLAAFLRFLDRPEDDVALWTVLNGSLLAGHPACGLDARELHDWRASHVCAPGQLRQAFRVFRPRVWEGFLAPFLSRAGLMTPYDALMEWCNRLDVWRRFPEADIFLRCFMEVLASAEENGLDSFSGFLYHWEQKGGLEKVPMPDKLDAVRVMTIHKSKGLEAPAVILPLTGRQIRGDRVALVERDGLRVVCKARAGMGDPYYRERMRQAVERINQLYVAFTRAREELHVIRPPARGRSDSGGVAAMNCLWRLAGRDVPHVDGAPPPAVSPSPRIEDSCAEAIVPPEAQAAELPGPSGDEDERPWRPMQWLPTLKIFRNPLGSAFRARDRGEFLHHCLFCLRGTRGDAAARAAIALQRGEESFARALPDDESLRQGVLAALTWAAGQPSLTDWLERGHVEQGLLLPWGDGLRAGRADCIVPGRRRHLILEFKSGRPDAAHVAQVRGYLSCLPSDLPATGLLVYLDERRFRRVDADGASAELAQLAQAFPLYDEV